MVFVNYGGGKYWYFKHSSWNGKLLVPQPDPQRDQRMTQHYLWAVYQGPPTLSYSGALEFCSPVELERFSIRKQRLDFSAVRRQVSTGSEKDLVLHDHCRATVFLGTLPSKTYIFLGVPLTKTNLSGH